MTMYTAADQSFHDRLDVSLAPGVIEEMAAVVARGLAALDDGIVPRLSHVAQEQIDSDWCSLAFHVHLTTDLVLPVELYGSPREIGPMSVIEAVRSLWPRRDVIVAAAETVRRAAETSMHRLQSERSGLYLRAAALTPVASWTGLDEPCLEFEIDVLGDDLRPKSHRIPYRTNDAFEDECRLLIQTQDRRIGLRRFLIDRGATGSMDQLTCAVLENLPDPEEVLRQLGRHEIIWPIDGLCMEWQEGRVTSSGQNLYGLNWNRSTIEIAGLCLPEAALMSAAERPITQLCEHPLLSSAMTISRAWQAPVEDEGCNEVLVVELDTVDHLFSSPLAEVDSTPLNFRTVSRLNKMHEPEW